MSEPAAHSAAAAPMKYPAPTPVGTPTSAKPIKYTPSRPGMIPASAVMAVVTAAVWVWAVMDSIRNGDPAPGFGPAWQWATLSAWIGTAIFPIITAWQVRRSMAREADWVATAVLWVVWSIVVVLALVLVRVLA